MKRDITGLVMSEIAHIQIDEMETSSFFRRNEPQFRRWIAVGNSFFNRIDRLANNIVPQKFHLIWDSKQHDHIG